MHRLSRQLSRSSTISRAIRAQRPSDASYGLPALRRTYATSDAPPPHRPKDKFDRLFASLRPGMKEDELALTIAGLISSTRNQGKIAKLESSIPRYIQRFNRDRLYEKVEHYIANPPEDNFESIIASSPVDADASSEPEAGAPILTSVTKILPTEVIADSDLPYGSPVGELISQLQAPSVRQVLENLESEEQAEFRRLISTVFTEDGREDMSTLIGIAQFLSYRGAEVRYTTQPRPVEEDDVFDWDAELEALDKISDTAESGSLPEQSLATGQVRKKDPTLSNEMDPVELAQLTAEDASTNPLTVPTEQQNDPYPDLMTPDPLMDSRDVQEFPPTKNNPYHNRVIIRNHSSIFHEALEADGFDFASEDWKPNTTDETEEELNSVENLPISPAEVRKLYKFPIFTRRITQQTGKGKMHRQFCLMVVGNGDGLVGYGQGKDEDAPRAEAKALAEAIRNMDWVERFEKRTVWTEMETKLGATRLILRPRPVGFGLRCNPNLHQVLKAAGIKDVSAKVWGSRNPLNVIKAAFRMLQSGHAPLSMGDGLGGSGRKLNKGSGLRSKSDVERERGRKLISLRK